MTIIPPALPSTVPPSISTSTSSTCIFQASCSIVIKISKHKVHVIITIKGNQDTSACLIFFSIPISLLLKGPQHPYFCLFFIYLIYQVHYISLRFISFQYHIMPMFTSYLLYQSQIAICKQISILFLVHHIT